ncbi:MAG: T9SS type A sorting domain-containing protein [Edaphocola sp.]
MKTFNTIIAFAAAMFFAVHARAQLTAPMNFPLPANAAAANVSAAEYFIDTDPGFGSGTSIATTGGSVDISSLATGVHRIYVRTKNANGNWSLTNVATFFILPQSVVFPANAAAANVTAAEYFIDTDPGLGSGTGITLTGGSNVTASNVAVDISSLAVGVHRIYVRTKNANGNWSLSNVATFYVEAVSVSIPPNASVGSISALEYFFDTDPGFGNGTMVSITPTTNLSNYSITADISTLQQDTTHTLYIRALDGWSLTTTTTFTIGTTLPVKWLSFTGKLQADNTVLLQWQTATETNSHHFEIERSGNGKDFAPIGKMAASGNSNARHSYQFTDAQPLNGTNHYRIKQVDNDGNFTYSSVLPVNVAAARQQGFYIVNNPARGVLRVHIGRQGTNARLRIFDMSGRQMLLANVTTADIQQINIAALPAGMYVLQYIGENEETNKRFVKE